MVCEVTALQNAFQEPAPLLVSRRVNVLEIMAFVLPGGSPHRAECQETYRPDTDSRLLTDMIRRQIRTLQEIK